LFCNSVRVTITLLLKSSQDQNQIGLFQKQFFKKLAHNKALNEKTRLFQIHYL